MTGSPGGRLAKRSLVVAGHRTSVSLEDAFWEALGKEAARRGLSLAALVRDVDAARAEANLSSALRVHALQAAMRWGGAAGGETSRQGDEGAPCDGVD